MTYSPVALANNVLARSFSEKLLITPMKLQKILYITASQYAKKAGGESLLENPFQTWEYGPVEYSVWSEFRPFSRRPITQYASDAAGHIPTENEHVDLALEESLREVWAATRDWGAVALSRLTHADGSAWSIANRYNWEFLRDVDILHDRTYQSPLGLT